MLLFRTIVRPHRAEQLCHRLVEAGLAHELGAVEVLGAGSQAEGGTTKPAGDADRLDLLPKVEICGMIEDADKDRLVELICQVCRSGRGGDGKIFILPLTG